jgi:hypothetical protein
MSQQFYSGVGGTASVGNPPLELPITDWQVNPSAQTTRFRNSKSGPFDIVESNWLSATVTISIEYDFSNSPFQSPAAIQVGSRLTNVKLFLHQSSPGQLDGPAWTFGSLVVTATPQSLPMTGRNITTRLTCASDGPFTYPS